MILPGQTLSVPVGGDLVHVPITAKTRSIRFSLKTSDPREGKIRQAEAVAYVEQWLEAKRTARPLELTHRQAMAIAGEYYRRVSRGAVTADSNLDTGTNTIRGLEDDWFEIELMRNVADLVKTRSEAAGTSYLEENFGRAVDGMLSLLALPPVSQTSRRTLLEALSRVRSDALLNDAKEVSGDYSPDANLSKFPSLDLTALQPIIKVAAPSQVVVTFQDLIDGWAEEAKAAGLAEATLNAYKLRVLAFSSYLGHDDATKVTQEDVIAYKEHRLGTISVKTKKKLSSASVRTNDLAAIKTVFQWGVTNKKVTLNPAEGVRVRATKKIKLRERDFTRAEAAAILKLANQQTGAVDQGDWARRWVPWLCAYTGARVGEILQLRREDIRMEDGVPIIRITPEAGTVKTKEAREVPLHAHLVEMGFMDYVKRYKGSANIFVDSNSKTKFRSLIGARLAYVAKMARSVVPDRNVAPNHGWRHTFKTLGFEVDIQEKVLDAICGHAPRSTGQAYGTVSLKTKIDAIGKFPRYEVDDGDERSG